MNKDYQHIRFVIERQLLGLEYCKLLTEKFYYLHQKKIGCAKKLHLLVSVMATSFSIEVEKL